MMRRYLTEAEQRALLAAPKGVACPLAQRDYHCLAALMLTGMRITEWSRLTVSMVKQAMATGWLVSPPEHCKGKRGNEYLVTEQLHVHLAALCKLSDQLGAGLVVPAAGQPLVWGRDIAGCAGALSVRSAHGSSIEGSIRGFDVTELKFFFESVKTSVAQAKATLTSPPLVWATNTPVRAKREAGWRILE